MDQATGLDTRILNMRNHIAIVYGLIIPEIRLTDNASLPEGTYIIRIQGVEEARSIVEPRSVLILLSDLANIAPRGRDVSEPVYGAAARWIDSKLQEEAALSGFSVVTPTEVVATHLLETIKSNFAKLFTRRAMRKLLDEFVAVSDKKRAESNRRIVDEFIPDKVPLELLQSVLKLLLEERVSIRNLPMILEAIAEAKDVLPNAEAIAEHVRQCIGFQLVSELQEQDGALPLIQLKPEWEDLFREHQIETQTGASDVALPPDEFNRLAMAVGEQISAAGSKNRYPAIVTSASRRRFLQTILRAKGISNPVLSFEEIGARAKPALLGMA